MGCMEVGRLLTSLQDSFRRSDPNTTRSVRQQTLLIDLKGLNELSFDTETNIVTVSPAITGGDLNPYLSKFGRFFAGGHCPTVGLGGFLLQG